MTWEQALAYATSPLGVGIIVGYLLSWLIEYVPVFSQLPPRAERLAFLAACLVVPLAAACLQALGGFRAWSWDPLIWQALQAGAIAFAAGTVKHTAALPSAAERQAYRNWLNRWYAER